jgi:hypothetical protein
MTDNTPVRNKLLLSSSNKSNNITRQTIAEGHYEKMRAKLEQLVSLAITTFLIYKKKTSRDIMT